MGLYSTNIEAPEQRDLAQEAEQINQVNTRYAPTQYALESQYRPKYAELDRSIAWDNLFADDGALKMALEAVGSIGQANRQANTASRTADIGDAFALGAPVQALQQGMNPEMFSLMNTLDSRAKSVSGPGRAENALAQSLGVDTQQNEISPFALTAPTTGDAFSPQAAANRQRGSRVPTPNGPLGPPTPERLATPSVNPALNATRDLALQELSLGRQLDNRSAKDIEQRVLEHYNQTGRAMDPIAAGAMASELAKAGEQRFDTRFNRAMNVVGADLGQQAESRAQTGQYRQGLTDLFNLQGTREANDFGQLQTALNNRIATQFDPFAGVLGRSSLNQTSFGQQAANANFNQNPTGATNLFNSYGSQLFGQNFGQANANARQQAAQGNDMLGGVIGGLFGMGGSILGG